MTAIVVNYDEAVGPVNLHDVAPAPLPPASPKRKRSSLRQEAKPFANRPEDTRFMQQRMPMWEPMLTLSTSIVICFVVSASCLALGVIIVTSSATLTSVRVEYDAGSHNSTVRGNAVAQQADGSVTDIENCYLDHADDANKFAANHTCYIHITLSEAISGPAYVFYELHGVYQNHRRFGSSIDRTQWTDEWDPDTTLTTCAPLTYVTSPSCNVGQCSDNITRAVFPCGLVANTMFNDIFWLHSGQLPNGDTLNRTHLVAKGTARTYPTHPTRNPTKFVMNDTTYLPVWKNPNLSRIIPPVDGDQQPHIASDYENSTAWVVDPLNADYGVGVGLENEHWRTWVEIAAMEPFRKAYGRIERDLPVNTTLVFAVQSNYYVRSFGGTKALVVSELSWFGTENYPLGIFFLAVGGLFFLAGTLFALRKCQRPRPLGDATTLEWKRKAQ